jgi:ABC-2 type transport system permease protein
VSGQWWLLAKQQLRARVRSMAIWGVALGALGALYVALFPTMSGFLEQYLEQASEQMQRFMGSVQDSMTIEGWLELEFLNSIVPIALPFLVIPIGARAVSGSEERKTLDMLLSNPLPRWHLVASTLATMAAALACALGITWVLTYIAVPAAGVDLGPGRLAAGLVVLWVFCLLFGSIALLVSAWVRRSFLAIVIPTVILVVMYVLANLAQISASTEFLQIFSLFYHMGHPIRGDFPWTAVLAMLAAVGVIGAGAKILFDRRDIYT